MAIAALFVMFAPACDSSPTEPSIVFRQLRPHGLIGPFACEPGVRVVRDAGEWAALSEGLQYAEPPTIDFGTEMIVLVSLGTRPTSGYSVEVQRARSSGGTLTIEAVEYTAGRCAALQVITCPGGIVAVPRGDAAVEVEWGTARPRPGCE